LLESDDVWLETGDVWFEPDDVWLDQEVLLLESVAVKKSFLALSLCVGCSAASTKVRWSVDTDAAWRAMTHTLPGRWHASVGGDKVVHVTYRMISNDSALLETFVTPSGKETATVYHLDGRGVMLTHYCAQGNQARLRATDASASRISFAFADATNVRPEQDVMHDLVLELGGDSFEEASVYRTTKGTLDRTVLHFERDP